MSDENGMKRFQVDLPPADLAWLESVAKEHGLRTKKDVVELSFTLLRWVMEMEQQGRTIVAIDPAAAPDSVTRVLALCVPGLTHRSKSVS